MKQPATPDSESRPILTGRDAFRAWLRERCDQSSVQAVAAEAGIKPSFLSNVLAGRSSIGDTLAERFGYGRRVIEEFYPLEEPAKRGKG